MHYANFGELDAPLGSWVGGVEILIEMQVGTWESVNNGVGDDLIAPSPDDRVWRSSADPVAEEAESHCMYRSTALRSKDDEFRYR